MLGGEACLCSCGALAAVACQVFKFSFLCARRLALLRSDAFGWQHRVCPRRHGPVLTLGPLAARVGGDAALGCRAALSLQAYGWERALCMGAAWRKGAQSPAS